MANRKSKEIEKVEEPKVDIEKLPQFKNNGEGIKIKLNEGKDFRWITVNHGEVVIIPRDIALANKLEEVK